MQLTFIDTVKSAINGFEASLFDKGTAIKMIEDSAQVKCTDCSEKSTIDFNNCIMDLKHAMDDEIETGLFDKLSNPLDEMSIGEAVRLYNSKSMQLPCRGGHIIGIFHETDKIKSNLTEVRYYEQNQEYCVQKLG